MTVRSAIFDDHVPGPDEMQWQVEYRQGEKSKIDSTGHRCRHTTNGWYIESQNHAMLTMYEVITIDNWCKATLEGKWVIGWDHIYIAEENDVIKFKLSWMV